MILNKTKTGGHKLNMKLSFGEPKKFNMQVVGQKDLEKGSLWSHRLLATSHMDENGYWCSCFRRGRSSGLVTEWALLK